jgi:hypothetical protein
LVFEALCKPCYEQVGGDGLSRRQQVERHALAERAHEDVYLAAVLAAQVAQQPLAPARVAA